MKNRLMYYTIAIISCIIEIFIYTFVADWLEPSGMWSFVLLIIFGSLITVTWTFILSYAKQKKTEDVQNNTDMNN